MVLIISAHAGPGDLVLEGSAEVALGTDRLLDLAANAAHRLELRVRELCDLEVRGEHPLDERRVLEDLVRLSHELQLLHDLTVRRGLSNATSRSNGHSLLQAVSTLKSRLDVCVSRTTRRHLSTCAKKMNETLHTSLEDAFFVRMCEFVSVHSTADL